MRYYLLTERDRKCILEFLRTRKRNSGITLIIHRIDESWDRLVEDFRLIIALKGLVNAGY
ncbi:hypothetical protein KEJ36_05330 [Candidatus Bathyarchaeota archaeon]|nr:hypothetical protein [Candidatus Bathyarchaeota archaeon]